MRRITVVLLMVVNPKWTLQNIAILSNDQPEAFLLRMSGKCLSKLLHLGFLLRTELLLG